MAAVDDYSQALDYLRLLARQDFADWWARRGELTDAELKVAFAELAANYGDEAASAAVDYLVMSRSLDDELAGLPFPERADPVAYEQAAASYQWAVNTSKADGKFLSEVAAAKLAGVLDRLVCLPAHQTVVNTILRDGTAFARVPEPGACAFCLMLASRGAVYTAETVGRVNKFHDHCRCLGIECKRDGSDLPQINKDLEREWIDLSDSLDRVPTIGDFRTHIEKLRESLDDHKSFELGNKKNAVGKIIPNGVKAAAHEQVTYDFLASLGHTVELKPVSNIDGVTSPDCWVDGVLVEVKAPIGAGKETIVQRIRKGRRQSPLIIIDLHRTPLSIDEAVRQTDLALARYDRVESVFIISQDKQIVRRDRG